MRLITGKSRGRLAAFGMLAVLFAAGLAFSVLEGAAGSRAMPSLGIGEDDEALTVPTDPRLDPYDCLYDPAAVRGLMDDPHAGEQADGGKTDLPAGHPPSASTPSQAAGGSPNSTSSGTSPSGSPEAPQGAPEDQDGSPSDDTAGSGEDTSIKPPHSWAGGDDCPGR